MILVRTSAKESYWKRKEMVTETKSATNAEATKAQKVITKITQKQVRPQLMLVKHTKHQHCSRRSQQPSFYHTVIIHVVIPLSYARRQCKRPLDGS